MTGPALQDKTGLQDLSHEAEAGNAWGPVRGPVTRVTVTWNTVHCVCYSVIIFKITRRTGCNSDRQ